MFPRPNNAALTTALLALAMLVGVGRCENATAVVPLPRAHAHNDYEHDRPLLDALDHGFCSVEADVFAVGGKLLVGHTPLSLRPDRTLEQLYLAPLRDQVRANGGKVFPGVDRFFLLVDFKTKAETTYPPVRDLLAQYKEILSHYEDGKWVPGAVTVVISGNRPSAELLAEESVRYAGLDGRTSDLDSELPADLMPMISEAWGTKFSWKGEGTIPDDQLRLLTSIVEQAHAKGRAVRFWATPEKLSVWRVLDESGVDLVNTDDLAGLRDYFLESAR